MRGCFLRCFLEQDVFAAGGQKFADNVVAFYEHLRDNHLYASYAIVPPQIDRSKPAHQQSDPSLYAGVVAERDDGIVLKGAQQLATGGLYSDYIYLSCIHPLQPGDENYALGVAVPMNAPGLKLYPRRPFALQATNSFDYPLSSRYDESDSFCVFENVFVTWEHVFIYQTLYELSFLSVHVKGACCGLHPSEFAVRPGRFAAAHRCEDDGDSQSEAPRGVCDQREQGVGGDSVGRSAGRADDGEAGRAAG